MPTSPWLGITELSPNQTDKTTTINDAILALEAATNASLAVDMSAGDVTLSVAQFTSCFIFAPSGQSADRSLNLPALINGLPTQRLFAVRNDDTIHNVTVQITGGAGASVVVTPGKSVLLTTDGAGNVVKLQTVNDLQFYRFGGFAVSNITSSEVLLDHVVVTDFVFPANFSGSLGSVGTNPAASYVLSIQKNNVEIGTLTISVTGVATYATTGGTAVSVAAGDVITVVAPATVDTFVERLRFTFMGTI